MPEPALRPTVKIYGERNTGTNYLSELLSQNLCLHLLPGVVPRRVDQLSSRADRLARALRVQRLRPGERIKDGWFGSTFASNLGWKHMLVGEGALPQSGLAMRSVFVTLSKNPYSWAVSLFKRPYHSVGERSDTLASFLSSPWRTVGRERAPKFFPSAVHLWNEKNRAYSTLERTVRTVNVLYEDLLCQPYDVVDEVRIRTSARMRQRGYSNVLDSTKGERQKGYAFYREYYLEEHWRRELTADAVSVINASVDRELVRSLGYDILDPEAFS